MKRTQLHDGWTASHTSGPEPAGFTLPVIPATVPGSVHTDLLAARLIDDPYLDANEASQAWIGQSDWRYRTTFDWSPGSDRVEIVFDGLDTVATVVLNGQTLLQTENMHRAYRADVAHLLQDGKNALTIDFASPVREADRRSLELGFRPHAMHHPYNALRKMACSFGWDWGLDTATSGIWRPVHLEEWSLARLGSVRPIATVQGTDGAVDVHIRTVRASDQPVLAVATIAGHTAEAILSPGTTETTLTLRVPDVELWWPRGYGEPALYDLAVELRTPDARDGALDTWRRKIGFRTVAVSTPADDAGIGFGVEVNGQPVFVKGANWIPDDAFPHRVDRARYARRVEQAAGAGCNLLRVWGGGLYESEDFYSLCDQSGILVWQDFLLACAAYSEDEPLRAEIEAEARENIARLAAHPSLVVLNGNNENLWGYADWGWEQLLDGQAWGAEYYYGLFPGIVGELAPHVAYTPGSPYTPSADGRFDPAVEPNDPSKGTMHVWDLWNQKDYLHYRDYRPRFVAEFGWQGPPTWSTLTRAISDNPLTPESPGMVSHQKATEGNTKLTRGLVPHFPVPNEMHDWHWAMQLNQANAVRTGIEWFRSLAPHCTGSIVWQLNDCWPVTSWAAVDGDGREKPLYAAIRSAYADRLLTIQPSDPASNAPRLELAAVNDTGEPWEGEVVVERRTLAGAVLASVRTALSVPPRTAGKVTLDAEIAVPERANSELIVAEFGTSRCFWFFAEYRDQALEPDYFTAEVEQGDGGIVLRITAQTLLRDVTVLADKLDPHATVDSVLVTLLPGESAEFRIRTSKPLTLAELTDPRVLRTANQLIQARACTA